MPHYSIILIIHVTAVFMLCAALSIEVLSLIRLRNASSLADARPWTEPVLQLAPFVVGSVLAILFSGIYLVIQESAQGRAWPKVAGAALLLAGILGAMTGKRLRAIREANAEKARESELLERTRDPFLPISLGLRIALFFGIFLLVSAKPGLWGSIGVVGATMSLGLLASLLASRRIASLPTPSAELGTAK